MGIMELGVAIKSLKIKNCEGHDQIPQRILVDAFDALQHNLVFLFEQIYEQKKIHEHWLIAKIILIFKKSNPKTLKITGH